MEGLEDRRRRQKEPYRRRRDRETAEQRQVRLERRREYDKPRRATMTTHCQSLNECTWTLTIAHPSNQF